MSTFRRFARKAGIGVGVVAVLVAAAYFYLIRPGQADVRYCQQFLQVMQQTHDLTTVPTPTEIQVLTTSVHGLAELSRGNLVFPGADAAALLANDVVAAGASPSADSFLNVSQDAEALAAACRSATGATGH